jgi:hypothetical protein
VHDGALHPDLVAQNLDGKAGRHALFLIAAERPERHPPTSTRQTAKPIHAGE